MEGTCQGFLSSHSNNSEKRRTYLTNEIIASITKIHLNGGEPSHDGGGAEPVRDHREVGEVPLDVGVEDGLGPGVAQGATVLVQEVHQLLGDSLSGQHQVLPPVLLHSVVGGPRHVLRYLPSRKFCLANIAEVPSQMNSLT